MHCLAPEARHLSSFILLASQQLSWEEPKGVARKGAWWHNDNTETHATHAIKASDKLGSRSPAPPETFWRTKCYVYRPTRLKATTYLYVNIYPIRARPGPRYTRSNIEIIQTLVTTGHAFLSSYQIQHTHEFIHSFTPRRLLPYGSAGASGLTRYQDDGWTFT